MYRISSVDIQVIPFLSIDSSSICNSHSELSILRGWKPDTVASFLSVVLACFFTPLFAHTLLHVFVWGEGESESSLYAWLCTRFCKRRDETKGHRTVGYYEGEYYEDNERQVRGRCFKKKKYYDPLFRERTFETKHLTTAQLLSLYEHDENGKDSFFGDTVRINSDKIPQQLRNADGGKDAKNTTIQPHEAGPAVDPEIQKLAKEVQEKFRELAITHSRTGKPDYKVRWITEVKTYFVYQVTEPPCCNICAPALGSFRYL